MTGRTRERTGTPRWWGLLVLASLATLGLSADFDADGIVGLADFSLFGDQFGKPVDESNRSFDLDDDGVIGYWDFFLFADDYMASVVADPLAHYRALGSDLIELAEAASERGEKEVAIAHCDRAVTAMDEMLELARSDADKHEVERAIASNYFAIGKVYKGLEEYEQAIGYFDQGRSLDPDNPWFHVELGSTYGFNLSQWDKGISHYKMALTIEPDRGDWAFGNLLYFYRNVDKDFLDLGEEIGFFSGMIEADPRKASIYSVRAYLHEERNMFDEAIEDRTTVVDLLAENLEATEDHADALLARGQTFEKSGDLVRAEADMLAAFDVEPAPFTLWELSGVRYAKEDWAGWSECLEQFLEFEDDDFVQQQEYTVRYNLASGYVWRQQLFSRGAEHSRTIADKFPDEENHDYRWWEPRPIRVRLEWETEADWFEGDSIELLLPIQNRCQEHMGYMIQPDPSSHRIYMKYGNTYASVVYADPVASIQVEVNMVLNPCSLAAGGFGTPDDDDTPERHVGHYSSGGFEYDPEDAGLVELVRTIVEGETDTVEKARLIHEWVYANFTYEVVSYPTIDEYLANKKGECGGYSMVFTALCRAAEIPTRRLFSPILDYPERGDLGSHVVSEFYDEDEGWILVDNTGNTFGWINGRIILWRGTDDEREYHYPDHGKTTVTYELNGSEYLVRVSE